MIEAVRNGIIIYPKDLRKIKGLLKDYKFKVQDGGQFLAFQDLAKMNDAMSILRKSKLYYFPSVAGARAEELIKQVREGVDPGTLLEALNPADLRIADISQLLKLDAGVSFEFTRGTVRNEKEYKNFTRVDILPMKHRKLGDSLDNIIRRLHSLKGKQFPYVSAKPNNGGGVGVVFKY